MTSAIALETVWGGVKFRSRTEARWAVYFDALGILWEYEREAYELTCETTTLRYLPDFWLPQVNTWAEVKGREFKDTELLRCALLARATETKCLLLPGPPAATNYWLIDDIWTSPGYFARDGDYMTSVVFQGIKYYISGYDCFVDDQYLYENRFYGWTGLASRFGERQTTDWMSDNALNALADVKSTRFW